MKIHTEINGKTLQFDIDTNGQEPMVMRNGQQVNYNLAELGYGRFSLIVDHQSYLIQCTPGENNIRVQHNGHTLDVRVESDRQRLIRELSAGSDDAPREQVIRAPIPGLVTRVLIEEGNMIPAGEALLALEAMKMENLIKAPAPCRVEKIAVQPGQKVEQDEVLLALTINPE